MATITIVRGLPGAGKSTYANTLNLPHFEADMFFVKDGEYKFNAAQLYHAHRWCLEIVKSHIEEQLDVVVSNTFTTNKELKDYVEYARENNYFIRIVECYANYGSIHNVPDETLVKMKQRWQEVPERWYDELIKIGE